MSKEKFDSIECSCGARLAVGNIGRKETPVLFVGGWHKNGMIKSSEGKDRLQRCLWCGEGLPESLQKALAAAKP